MSVAQLSLSFPLHICYFPDVAEVCFRLVLANMNSSCALCCSLVVQLHLAKGNPYSSVAGRKMKRANMVPGDDGSSCQHIMKKVLGGIPNKNTGLS